MADLTTGGALPFPALSSSGGTPVVFDQPPSASDLAHGFGAIAPPPAPSNPAADRIAQARAAGYSWDEIGQELGPRIAKARQAGYSDQEISTYYGAKDPTELQQALTGHMQTAGQSDPASFMGKLKEQYAKGLTNGQTMGPLDFVNRVFYTITDAAQAGMELTGDAIYQTAKHLGLPEDLARDLAAAPGAFAGHGGEASVEAVKAKIAKDLPQPKDITDAAVALQQQTMPGIKAGHTATVETNLANHWAKTGEMPAAAAARAEHDPALRIELLAPQNPPEPLGSSTTPHPEGDFVVPRAPGHIFPTPGDVTKDTLDTFAHLEGSGDAEISRAGAVGHWQIMPATARDYGFDPARLQDRAYNENVARAILSDLSKKFNGDEEAMAVAYNAGPARAQKWLDEGRDKSTLPKETQAYLARLNEYRGGRGGKPPGEPPEEPPAPGSFEEDRAALLDRIGTSGPSLWERMKTGAETFYTEMFRGDHPLVKLQDAIEKGTTLEDKVNPRFLRRLAETDTTAKYAIERGMTDLEGNVTGPALKTILPAGKDLDDLRAYGIARWAIEKAAQAKETGVELEQAKRVSAALGGRFESTFAKLVDFQNGSLQWLRDSGILSQEAFLKMVDENTSRIPGYRVDLEEGGPGAPRGGKTVRNPIRQFFGSDKKIADPIDSILRDTFVRAQLARKANADRALVDAADAAGMAEKTTATPRKFELTDAELSKFGAMGDLDTDAIWRAISPGLRDNEVPVFRDGKMEAWKFDDPSVVKVLRGMDRQTLAVWQRMMRPLTTFFRGATVLNPFFPVRLLAYDVPWQFIVKPGFRNTVADVIAGAREMSTNSAAYDRYLRSGTAERIFGGLAEDRYIRDLLAGKGDNGIWSTAFNAAKSPLRLLQAWSAAVTQSQRVGRFTRGVAAGETPLRAGVASTEAAFHRAGFGGPVSKALNTLHPFFTAQLNGLEQMARAQFGIGKTPLGEAYNPLTFTAKATALITVPMLANWYANRNEEWYKAMPDWQKNSGLGFNVGGVTIYLPMPPLLGFLYGGLPRMLAEGFIDQNPRAFDHLAGDAAASLLPPGFREMASITAPVIEHLANYSFFRGRPLVPDGLKGSVLPPEQANHWSTGAARALSQFADDWPLLRGAALSPPVIDNYIQGWAGTLGTAAVRTADLVLGTGPHAGNPPETAVADMPLLSSWMARYPSATAQPIIDFQANIDAFAKTHGSIEKAMESGDLGRFEQLLAESPAAAAMHRFALSPAAKIAIGEQPLPVQQQFQTKLERNALSPEQTQDAQLVLTAQQAMKQQRLFAEMVGKADATKLSPSDKRQQLDRLYAGMQLIAEKALPAMHRLGMDKR